MAKKLTKTELALFVVPLGIGLVGSAWWCFRSCFDPLEIKARPFIEPDAVDCGRVVAYQEIPGGHKRTTQQLKAALSCAAGAFESHKAFFYRQELPNHPRSTSRGAPLEIKNDHRMIIGTKAGRVYELYWRYSNNPDGLRKDREYLNPQVRTQRNGGPYLDCEKLIDIREP